MNENRTDLGTGKRGKILKRKNSMSNGLEGKKQSTVWQKLGIS